MPLFEVDDGRPVPVRATGPRGALRDDERQILDANLVGLLGERIFPVASRTAPGESEPYLLALDAVGLPIVIEVVSVLTKDALTTALNLAVYFALEKLILDRDSMAYKAIVAQKYAQLVYDGRWLTPLREAIDAFVDVTQQEVTGTVRMKLYKGSAIAVATKAPASLYSEEFATFGEDEVYNQKDAEGFINLTSLSMKIRAIQKQKQRKGGRKK